jgi:hypothetical protein
LVDQFFEILAIEAMGAQLIFADFIEFYEDTQLFEIFLLYLCPSEHLWANIFVILQGI